MKISRLALAALTVAVSISAKCFASALPDSCGDPAVTFDVTDAKGGYPSAAPSSDMGRIVLIQVTDIQGSRFMNFGTSEFTIRFGIDGAWKGAVGNNSFLVVDVPSGDHHLCVAGQGSSTAKKMVAATPLTVEPGKTYYLQFMATRIGGQSNYYHSAFTRLNEDEGAYHVKALPMASSTPKKQ